MHAQAKEFAQLFLAKTPWNTARLVWTGEDDGDGVALIAAANRVRTDRECAIAPLPLETENGVYTTAISGAKCPLKADYSLSVKTTKPEGSSTVNYRAIVERTVVRSASSADAADGLAVSGVVIAEKTTGWSGRENDVPYADLKTRGRISLLMKSGDTLDITTEGSQTLNGARKLETKQVNHFATYKGIEFILTTYERTREGRTVESRTFVNGKDLNEILEATGGL